MLYKAVTILCLCFCVNIKGLPIDDRIVNGTDAAPAEFPQIVSLRVVNRHSCGATILNEYFLLTAAHCLAYDIGYYNVQYGVSHIVPGEDAPNLINISRMIQHENYTAGNGFFNDIGLVQLATPLTFNANVQPVRLVHNLTSTPEDSPATLIGWGRSSSLGFVIEDLQKVGLWVYPDADCERIHAETGPANRTVHICAGVPEGGKGQCSGDSGGPLFVDGRQVGIVSWSVKPCTVKGFPGVFTKVSSYIDWINTKMAEAGFSSLLS